jgi:hypothetical protein
MEPAGQVPVFLVEDLCPELMERQPMWLAAWPPTGSLSAERPTFSTVPMVRPCALSGPNGGSPA